MGAAADYNFVHRIEVGHANPVDVGNVDVLGSSVGCCYTLVDSVYHLWAGSGVDDQGDAITQPPNHLVQ